MTVFLTRKEVIREHERQIAFHGGLAGIRDLGLLDSALAMPKASFGGTYLHADIYEMAATYLFHIVSNHPFLDGNKRTGTATALFFLTLNGIDHDIDDNALVSLALSVARSEIGKEEIATFFRKHCS